MSRSTYASLLKLGKVEDFNAFRRTNPEARIDLSKFALDGANMAGADLRNADLSQASLRDANLSGANLSGANLFGASLARANLRSANLTRATLDHADLRKAILQGANTEGASFEGADSIQPFIKGDAERPNPKKPDVPDGVPEKANPCDACPYEEPLPTSCDTTQWAPLGCKKWIQSEMSLSGLLTRIGAERKLIKSVPDDQFAGFIEENASHLVLVKWKKNRAKLITKDDYLAFYTEILFKML